MCRKYRRGLVAHLPFTVRLSLSLLPVYSLSHGEKQDRQHSIDVSSRESLFLIV